MILWLWCLIPISTIFQFFFCEKGDRRGFYVWNFSWVKILYMYSDIQTCVMNNGWVSEKLKNCHGSGQRMSFISIVVCFFCRNHGPQFEKLQRYKRNNSKIRWKKEHSIKISQLAVDTTLFCNSKEDVLKAMNEIEIFGSFSGLLLNRNKQRGCGLVS